MQEPVMNSLSAVFNGSNLKSKRVSINIKLSVVSIVMKRNRLVDIRLIRIYDICNWWDEENKKVDPAQSPGIRQ